MAIEKFDPFRILGFAKKKVVLLYGSFNGISDHEVVKHNVLVPPKPEGLELVMELQIPKK